MEATIRGEGNVLGGLDLADLLEEFVERVAGAVEDGSTYPLFDDLTGNFVTEAIRHGFLTVSETDAARSRHSGLCSDLLQRLPLFERASLSDVLAIRHELEGPLLGFYIAVADFSREIRSAAWETDFIEEADVLFREKVEPEVERNQTTSMG